jgi:hypothetical protein
LQLGEPGERARRAQPGKALADQDRIDEHPVFANHVRAMPGRRGKGRAGLPFEAHEAVQDEGREAVARRPSWRDPVHQVIDGRCVNTQQVYASERGRLYRLPVDDRAYKDGIGLVESVEYGRRCSCRKRKKEQELHSRSPLPVSYGRS